MTQNKKYDCHIAVIRAGDETISFLQDYGFTRDSFSNFTRCQVDQFHGTLRKKDPETLLDEQTWNDLCHNLKSDERFIGDLEFEETIEDNIRFFHLDNFVKAGKAEYTSMPITDRPKGKHKAGDIHISIDTVKTDGAVLLALDGLEISSFEREKQGALHKIYTITLEHEDDGLYMLDKFAEIINTSGQCHGRAKYERLVKAFRYPDDAPVLPWITKDNLSSWKLKNE